MKNIIKEDEEGTYIEITSKTYGIKKCYIDKEDIEKVQECKWSLKKNKRIKVENVFYVRGDFKINGIWKQFYLHRYLLEPEKGLHIDHIDGDPLNNRRSNLRAVTNQENHFNRKAVKGYCWDKRRRKYKSKIRVGANIIYLGYFTTEQEAKAAYLAAKQIHHVIEEKKA